MKHVFGTHCMYMYMELIWSMAFFLIFRNTPNYHNCSHFDTADSDLTLIDQNVIGYIHQSEIKFSPTCNSKEKFII